VDITYLERVLGAERQAPERVLLGRLKRPQLVPVLKRTETRRPVAIARCVDCFAPNKPALALGRRTTWAEFVVVELLRRDGWSAVWVKNWSGPGGAAAIQFCRGIGRPARLVGSARRLFDAINDQAGHPAGGIWDVFAWRGTDYLWIESKAYPASKDRLDDDPGKGAWLEAALAVGMTADAFAVVRYDAGHSLGPGLPVINACPDRGG
jgi:hypothetical protein